MAIRTEAKKLAMHATKVPLVQRNSQFCKHFSLPNYQFCHLQNSGLITGSHPGLERRILSKSFPSAPADKSQPLTEMPESEALRSSPTNPDRLPAADSAEVAEK